MLDSQTAKFIGLSTKFSIRRFMSPESKLLLIDILYFMSIASEFHQNCTNADIDAVHSLIDYCKSNSIDPAIYVSCAYSYMSRYITKGRKTYISYLLSDNIKNYVSTKLLGATTADALISNRVRSDIMVTEKLIRQHSIDTGITYIQAFILFRKLNRVSDTFLLYKYYQGNEMFSGMDLPEHLAHLYNVLEPIFILLSAKHGVYAANRTRVWRNSNIESFGFCPIWFRDLVLNEAIPPNYTKNEASDSGTLVHSFFEDVIDRFNKSKTRDITKTFNSYLKSKKFIEQSPSVQEHIPGFIDFFTNPNSPLIKNLNKDTILHTEKYFSLDLKDSDIVFNGTVDLIIQNGSEAIVVDYKTSKIADPKWLEKNNDKYFKQLSLYACFIERELGLSVKEMHVVYTRGLLHSYPRVDRTMLDTRISEITKIRALIRLNSFKPNCKSCRLCRHPDCSYRSVESMWDDNGRRKTN